jgi:hypothetical protein
LKGKVYSPVEKSCPENKWPVWSKQQK